MKFSNFLSKTKAEFSRHTVHQSLHMALLFHPHRSYNNNNNGHKTTSINHPTSSNSLRSRSYHINNIVARLQLEPPPILSLTNMDSCPIRITLRILKVSTRSQEALTVTPSIPRPSPLYPVPVSPCRKLYPTMVHLI